MSFPVKEMSPRDHALPMTHDEALSIIEHARKDKFLAQELEQLREKCCLFVSDVMHEVNQALAERDRRTPALLRSKPGDALSLRAASREREQAAQKRRELAEAMVIGALFNSDNPDWNPLDPSTHRSSGSGSLLLALLRTSLE
ncbi:hypothetical protein [Herbaspirillum sp. RV1423]|uniref:hypothetical protein n=1 Tax=Herbaspirillum sp. RV1423 TaxID=1443993 RepID=UPI0004B87DFE|nr:hypothetical protein [Herbaspirillum sp. RV1423]